MGHFSGTRIAYRAGGVGWVKTIITRRPSSTMYLSSGRRTFHSAALGAPDGVYLNPGRDPACAMSHGHLQGQRLRQLPSRRHIHVLIFLHLRIRRVRLGRSG
eukprot:9483686-Pyramimonas_sp.AAC.1